MKMMKRIATIVMIGLLVLTAVGAQAVTDGFSTSYTYNYDYWTQVQESPDAYRVSATIDSASLGLSVAMKTPQSIYIRDEEIYIVDTGNNRIIQVHKQGTSYRMVREITEIKGCEKKTLNQPGDVYVDRDGNLYIADTQNERVVKTDKDLNFILAFTKPSDYTFDQSLSFLPSKITVDVAGRVYIMATNVNKGFAKFEADGKFTGFVGANEVSVNLADYIWREFFLPDDADTEIKNFVPTEYANLYMDQYGFIYAVTNTVLKSDLMSGTAKPIRRINGMGKDILVKNDHYPPIGDLQWNEKDGPSRIVDITVLDNDIYVVFDRTRGRIFGYDPQGIMLWAFGTTGHIDGAFIQPVAIDHMGVDLYCLDQRKSNITVFTPTEYGDLIYRAYAAYNAGEYEASADIWREVLKRNANYTSAYIGVARAMLRQDDYEGAMKYFSLAHDAENYGRAFRLYRKEWVEKNILWVVIVLIVLIMIPLVIGKFRKFRREVEEYERDQVHK